MHTKQSLINNLTELRIDPHGTLLVHTSYKSIGGVEGGAETVIDALLEYMKDGTIVIPSHTWDNIRIGMETIMDVENTPTCIGIVPELFRRRQGVYRSWHPTHSVAAYGKKAEWLTSGDEKVKSPCGRTSALGKILDERATILLIGVDFTRNTFIHGIEEWNNIPGRLNSEPHELFVRTPENKLISTPQYRHSEGLGSETYGKIEPIMLREGVMHEGRFGDALAKVCDAYGLNRVLSQMLAIEPDLLGDLKPLDASWDKVKFS